MPAWPPCVSFVPLAFVGFKGLAELGIILTMGILVMLVATLILAPGPGDWSREKCRLHRQAATNVRRDRPPSCTSVGHRPGLMVAVGD